MFEVLSSLDNHSKLMIILLLCWFFYM